jgi:hypothetical protein
LFASLKQQRFGEEEKKFIFTQLVHCVQHLHSKGIIHADIKPLNIIRDGTKWKLIDFDASCKIGEFIGWKSSTAYIPPEALYIDNDVVKVRSSSNNDQLLVADTSFDIWSLGCILYQFCHPGKKALFAADQDDNLSPSKDSGESLWTLASWGHKELTMKLTEITDEKARNLISLMLSRDPSHRPSLSRIVLHPFISGKTTTRLSAQAPAYDVFISYRVASDSRHVEYLYNLLCDHGLKVWWDKICLKPGVPWEQGFCSGLVDSKAFVCLLSKEAINHPDRPWQNFSQLHVQSKCDNVFLEHRLALELRALGFIEKIFPVMIGDADDPSITPSPTYTNYFRSGCSPNVTDVHVESVEVKLLEHMYSQALGEPLEKKKTVKSTLDDILANQGGFIEGDGVEAFKAVAERILAMIHESNKEEQNSDYAVSLTRDDENEKRILMLEQENLSLKEEASSLKAEALSREKENSSWREENFFLREEASLLKDKLTVVDRKNASLSDEVAALKRELQLMKQKNRP